MIPGPDTVKVGQIWNHPIRGIITITEILSLDLNDSVGGHFKYTITNNNEGSAWWRFLNTATLVEKSYCEWCEK